MQENCQNLGHKAGLKNPPKLDQKLAENRHKLWSTLARECNFAKTVLSLGDSDTAENEPCKEKEFCLLMVSLPGD